jgi:uncharacterized protein (PEP-CTERM system associated)
MRIYKVIILIFISIVIFFHKLTPAYCYELTLIPKLALSAEYDDNLYLDRENEKEDFITVITPGFVSSLRWETFGFNATYDQGHSFYSKYDENDNTRHHGDVGIWWNISRNTMFSIGDTFDRSEDISTLPVESTERVGRATIDTNSAHIDRKSVV